MDSRRFYWLLSNSAEFDCISMSFVGLDCIIYEVKGCLIRFL